MTEKIIKNLMPVSIVIAGALIAGVLFYQENPKKELADNFSSVSEVAEKTVNFINQNLLRGQATVSLIDAVEENGLYKMKFKLGENEITSYATRDGKLFFPDVINLEENPEELPDESSEEPSVEVSEADAVSLEVLAKCLTEKGFKFYGSSHCGWCAKQKELFGGAAQYLPYIECVDAATNQIISECQVAEISGFPTWQFPNGEKSPGYKTLEQLTELSGCALP